MTRLTSGRRRKRPMPPWLAAEHVAGFLLGLALAAMAIDYGYQRPTQTLPPTPTIYAGP
jgi:hypothetical protein